MDTVADYTEPSLVLPLLRSHDAAGATAELCSLLYRSGRIDDLLPFYHAVISHEAVSSTFMPPGWALPHARLGGIQRLSFALGRTAEPMPWFDGKPVSLIFLFAVPEDEAAAYLNLLAGLAGLSQNRPRLGHLANAPHSEAMFKLLQEVPLPRAVPSPAVATAVSESFSK
jgi:nitrogen PTS system EIIA component